MAMGNHQLRDGLSFGRDSGRLNRAAPLAVAVILLGCIVWVRFFGITRIGMPLLGDGHYYLRMGQRWLEEGPFGGQHYRPVAFLIQAMAIKVFGYNDYAVKLVHAGFDVASVVLIYLIAWRITRDFWMALIPSSLYAFLPYVIALSRDEMIHAPSTTFVLLAFFLILIFREAADRPRIRFPALFASGLSLSAAIHIHQELVLLVFAWLGFILFAGLSFTRGAERTRRIASDIAAFGSGGILLAGVFLALIGPAAAVDAMLYQPRRMNMKIVPESAQLTPTRGASKVVKEGPALIRSGYRELPRERVDNNFLDVSILPARLVLNSLEVISGRDIYGGLFVFSMIVACGRAFGGRRDDMIAAFPFVVIGVYAFGYAVAMGRFPFRMARLFLPLFPFVLIAIGYWIPVVMGMLLRRWAISASLIGALVLILIHPHVLQPRHPFLTRPSYYKEVHDFLGDKVDDQNRLLVTPWRFCYHLPEGGFSHPVYFGSDAFHIGHQAPTGQSLGDLADDMNVKYVYIGRTGILRRDKHDRDFYGLHHSNPMNSYSVKRERQIVDAFIERAGGVRIFESERGEVYQIRDTEAAEGVRNRFFNCGFETPADIEPENLSDRFQRSGRYAWTAQPDGAEAEVRKYLTPWYDLASFNRARIAIWFVTGQVRAGRPGVRARYADAEGNELALQDGDQPESLDIPLPLRRQWVWDFRSHTIPKENWPAGAAQVRLEFVWLSDGKKKPAGTIALDDLSLTLTHSDFPEPVFYRQAPPFVHLGFFY